VLERDPASRATCLVQRKYAQAAAARLELIGLASPAVADRIRLVEGDVSRADLGLGGKIEELLESTSEIWHLAAVYDLSVARDAALRVNVEGTQNVLELARHCSGLERLQYVSTCYVSGRYAGIFREEDLEKGQAFNNPYEETKYLAELSVRAAMGEGLPVTVYRPSIVVGDSRTGETQKYDGPYVIIRWVLRQPGTALVPVVGDPDATRVNLVPRDFVIDAISHLSGLPHSVGRTYQLADPQPPTVSEMLDVIESATEKRLRRMRLPRRAAKWAIDKVPGVHRLTGIPAAAVDYFEHPTHYTTFQARIDLEGSGLRVPAFDSYADRLVRFVRDHPEVDAAGMA
jgi:thioester reductase-like protein